MTIHCVVNSVSRIPQVNMASQEVDPATVENASNLTGREAASREGLIVAYSSLMLMAVVPILVGSLRSVRYHYNLRVSQYG